MYDYVIVGAGPSSLAFAQCCDKINKKILIIDKHQNIGGCHRVTRVNKLFSEHGPRIYSSRYVVFRKLLNDMGLDFYSLFAPYQFNLSTIGQETILNVLSFYECSVFILLFSRLFWDKNYGKDISVLDMMDQYQFSTPTRERIDRICRLTDGAGVDRYTLHSFLSLLNQQFFYSIYQPKKPLDTGLFQVWKKHLLKKNNVTFLYHHQVEELIIDDENNVQSIISSSNGKSYEWMGKTFILAIPPMEFIRIFKQSSNLSAPYVQSLEKWALQTRYNDYISITFHYDTVLQLPKTYGFNPSNWGLIYIILTDYMALTENESKTLLSISFCYNNRVSKYSGKTANESTEQELFDEAWNELKEQYPSIPYPTKAILSPNVIRSGNQWISLDTAFIKTSQQTYIPHHFPSISNLYNVGTHNGNHSFPFTSLESAVTNAVHLSHLLEPQTTSFRIPKTIELTDMIKSIILLCVVVFMYRYVLVSPRILSP